MAPVPRERKILLCGDFLRRLDHFGVHLQAVVPLAVVAAPVAKGVEVGVEVDGVLEHAADGELGGEEGREENAQRESQADAFGRDDEERGYRLGPTASATTSPASAAVWMTSIQSLGCSAHHLIGSITGLGTSAGAMLPVVPSIQQTTGPRRPGATECKRVVTSSAHSNTRLPDTGE